MNKKYQPLTKEEQAAVDLKASGEHNKSLRISHTLIQKLYYPTWEAGRACGFHAGLAKEREKTTRLLEILNKLACWHEGDEVTGKFDSPWAATEARAAIEEYWKIKK